MKRRLYMMAAAWLALGASGAHAAQAAAEPCVTVQEAEAVITALMPQVLAGVQGKCRDVLPATSYLRTKGDALVSLYSAAGKVAEAVAAPALAKIAGVGEAMTMTPEMFAMMAPMMAMGVAEEIKADDCGRIDQIAALLDPLPPANLSALAVALIELSGKSEKAPQIRICKPAMRVKG